MKLQRRSSPMCRSRTPPRLRPDREDRKGTVTRRTGIPTRGGNLTIGTSHRTVPSMLRALAGIPDSHSLHNSNSSLSSNLVAAVLLEEVIVAADSSVVAVVASLRAPTANHSLFIRDPFLLPDRPCLQTNESRCPQKGLFPMASTGEEQGHAEGSEGGVPPLFQQETQTFSGSCGISTSIGSAKACGAECRGQHHDREGSHSSGTGRLAGLLQQNLCGSEKVRRLSSRNRSVTFKPIDQERKVQDGDSQVHQAVHSTGGLGHISRSEGCVFPHFDAPQNVEIPQIRVVQCRLSVRGSAIRPLTGPVYLHYGGTSASSSGTQKRNTTEAIHRRLADTQQIQSSMLQRHSGIGGSDTTSGLQHQAREIRVQSINNVSLSRHDVRHSEIHGSTQQRSCSFPHSTSDTLERRPCSEVPRSVVVVRQDGVHGNASSVSKSVQTSPTATTLSESDHHGRLRSTNCTGTMVSRGNDPMDRSELATVIGQDSTIDKSDLSLHGRFNQGLGRSHRPTHSVGIVDCSGIEISHQSSRNGSCETFTEETSTNSSGPTCHDLWRQHDMPVLSPQSGRDHFDESFSHGRRDSLVGSVSPYFDQHRVHSGETERVGRSVESQEPDSSDRVDNRPSVSGTVVASVGKTAVRPVCHTVQQAPSTLHFTDARSTGARKGCIRKIVGRPGGVRLSSDEVATTSVGQSCDRQATHDFDRALLASSTMVSRSTLSRKSRVHSTESDTRNIDSAAIRDRKRQRALSEADRLVSVTKGLEKCGLSKASVRLALKAKRKSTNANYDHKWGTWTRYCREQKKPIDPLHPKPHHIANFLSQLFTQQNLAHATLCNYRSAITTTIKAARGCDVSHLSSDPHIAQVLEGVKNEFPEKQVQTPLWDVFLVLKYLRGAPFEPIQNCSLKLLTQKAFFLVMFACSRRLSGMHALSGLDKDVEFSSTNDSCILSFLPEFRAKNQDALSDSQCVEIPSLSRILGPDDQDLLNCPVRMIKQYLKRTHAHRLGKRRFFISTSPSYKKDISKNTMAAWLRDLITDAYRAALLEPPVGASRTHELRKVSTSLGHSRNVSMANLMKAAYWRSENTFTSYYLRDIRAKRLNDTFGISKVVAAGMALKL